MKNKFIHTVRWQFIFVFILSIVFAAGTVLLAYRVVKSIIGLSYYSGPLRWVVNNIGSTPVMVVVGAGCFLFIFYFQPQDYRVFGRDHTGRAGNRERQSRL